MTFFEDFIFTPGNVARSEPFLLGADASPCPCVHSVSCWLLQVPWIMCLEKNECGGERPEIRFKTRPHSCSTQMQANVWCHGSHFSLGLLHLLLLKPGWALSLKSYFCGALGCETGKLLFRVYCILLLHCQRPKAMELTNPLSSEAMSNRQA